MNNSRCNPIQHSLDTKKGKSFNFAGKLKEGAYYFNDNFVQDFVTYNGALLACKRSHQCTADNMPELYVESSIIKDVVLNPYWDYVFSGAYTSTSNIVNIEYDSAGILIIHHVDGSITKINLSERLNGVFIHIGQDEPSDSEALWIDPTSNTDPLEANSVDKIVENINIINSRLDKLETLHTAIIPGDANNNWRSELANSSTPVNPDTGEEDTDTEKPELSVFENPTTKHVCVKHDLAQNFKKENLIDGELIFYTDRKKFAVYYGGKFYVLTSSDDSNNAGLSEQDLYNLNLLHLNFTDGENVYKARVIDGVWTLGKYTNSVNSHGQKLSTWNVYVNHLLCINSVYCGGNYDKKRLVSHNYVELANGSKTDINLNGLVLLYTDGTKTSNNLGHVWHKLELNGIIPAERSFVIRGARCNSDKSSFISVNSYDMEWKNSEGDLISFKQGLAGFFLCTNSDELNTLLSEDMLLNPWTNNDDTIIPGYIDSCGFGNNAPCENKPLLVLNGTVPYNDWSNILFVRWYMFEPAKQGNKAYTARSSAALWTYINLDKQTTCPDDNIVWYYPDYMKQRFAPKASYNNKDFFTNKNVFSEKHPNIINITFGIQATDNGRGATRCFNWISVGYYNEYVEFRKAGTDGWMRVNSINDDWFVYDEDLAKFKNFYNRLRWVTSDGTWVTTHKCIIRNIMAGNYEYRIRREDSDYTSDILQFRVKSNNSVKDFSFVQVSDQQGFNWAEYTAWARAAEYIDKNVDLDFTINTGDISQSGNRVNEWLDYYAGRKYLRDVVEMFTIGNNDLCGVDTTELTDGEDATSKYNHINVLRYFTFELDPDNEYEFEWIHNGESRGMYPIYSLYSFNYGDYHFISFNSEVAKASSKMYVDSTLGEESFAESLYKHVENWLLKDLQNWQGVQTPQNCSKCIVYCHEMPFTIVTYKFMTTSDERAGSKSNTMNANGHYRYSRLFKKYGIRLVIGGHKHTFSISKPIYDAPANYPNVSLIENISDAEAGLTLGAAESRIPVIQVTSQEDVKQSQFARYEVVDKFDAPTYVMCQATGYKLVSNKEQPSEKMYNIPWLLSYFAQPAGTGNGTKENVQQHKPMYIRYELNNNRIRITAHQIENIWNVVNDTASFDINNQIPSLDDKAMTLTQALGEDLKIYALDNYNADKDEYNTSYYLINL